MLKECPNCNNQIVYSYNIDNDSYYLCCKTNYNCWHKKCDKSIAIQYPKLITYSEELLENMIESIENGDDYYRGFNF